jgi:hypothetical protein
MSGPRRKRIQKADWWWRLRWHWHAFWSDHGRKAREKRQRFTNLTGLHACYVEQRYLEDDEVIAIQARKIRGLELQINQQRKGYRRKIAKLEARLALADTSGANDRTREDH